MKIKINKQTGIVTIDDGKRIDVKTFNEWMTGIEQETWWEQVKLNNKLC